MAKENPTVSKAGKKKPAEAERNSASDVANTIKGASLEELFARIDKLVQAMDDPAQTLDESLECFEQGMAMTREAQIRIESAEQRVRTLVDDDDTADGQH